MNISLKHFLGELNSGIVFLYAVLFLLEAIIPNFVSLQFNLSFLFWSVLFSGFLWIIAYAKNW